MTEPFNPTPESMAAEYGRLVAHAEEHAHRHSVRSKARAEALAQKHFVEAFAMPMIAGQAHMPGGGAHTAVYRADLWNIFTANRVATARQLREERRPPRPRPAVPQEVTPGA